VEQENIFYYITVMNEAYSHPGLQEGTQAGILKGLYLLKPGLGSDNKVHLLGSGTILREVIAAADLLRDDYGVSADIWSATSFNELRRDGQACNRWNMLHPDAEPQVPYITELFSGKQGPFIAATDYVRAYADQVREFVPGRYVVLGTDGFGRSDTRRQLRKFFEVNRYYIALAALSALADEGRIGRDKVADAMTRYNIDADKPAPWTV